MRSQEKSNEATITETKTRKDIIMMFTVIPINIKTLKIKIVGTERYLSIRYGGVRQKWNDNIHYSDDGWAGIPTVCFRNAIISASKFVNYKKPLAKFAIMIESDGIDRDDNTPLVKITKGEFQCETVSIPHPRYGLIDERACLPPGWEALLNINYDSELLDEQSMINLVKRAGLQVGIGKGRVGSHISSGIGAGSFKAFLSKIKTSKNRLRDVKKNKAGKIEAKQAI